jgi:hypothetical protein
MVGSQSRTVMDVNPETSEVTLTEDVTYTSGTSVKVIAPTLTSGQRLMALSRSDDGGDTWADIPIPYTKEKGKSYGIHAGQGLQGTRFFSLAVDPADLNSIYLAGDSQRVTAGDASQFVLAENFVPNVGALDQIQVGDSSQFKVGDTIVLDYGHPDREVARVTAISTPGQPDTVLIQVLDPTHLLVASRQGRLGELFVAYGFCDQVMHVFLATELEQGENLRFLRHLQVVSHRHPQGVNPQGCLSTPTCSGRFSDVRSWPHFSVR